MLDFLIIYIYELLLEDALSTWIHYVSVLYFTFYFFGCSFYWLKNSNWLIFLLINQPLLLLLLLLLLFACDLVISTLLHFCAKFAAIWWTQQNRFSNKAPSVGHDDWRATWVIWETWYNWSVAAASTWPYRHHWVCRCHRGTRSIPCTCLHQGDQRFVRVAFMLRFAEDSGIW